MALKIARPLPKAVETVADQAQEETLTPYAYRLRRIAEFLQSDPLVSDLMRPDHPLFVFDIKQMGDSLAYRVSFRHAPEQSVNACATLVNAENGLIEHNRFVMAFQSAIRSLLFWSDAANMSYYNIRLINPENGVIDWSAVVQFVGRSLSHLPFGVEYLDTQNGLAFILAPNEPVTAAPVRLSLSKQGLQDSYGDQVHQIGLELANEALQDTLMIQLSRTILSLMTPDQANRYQEAHQQVPRSELASDEPVKTLSEKLSSQVSGLSLAPKG